MTWLRFLMGFPQYLPANAMGVPRIRQRLHPSTSLPVNYPRIILFNTILVSATHIIKWLINLPHISAGIGRNLCIILRVGTCGLWATVSHPGHFNISTCIYCTEIWAGHETVLGNTVCTMNKAQISWLFSLQPSHYTGWTIPNIK